LWAIVKNDSESALGVWGVCKRVRPLERRHDHNTSLKRTIAAESNAHQIPRGTVMLDAEDFALPELELVPEPELGLEFGDVLALVPEPEPSPEAVTWPEVYSSNVGKL